MSTAGRLVGIACLLLAPALAFGAGFAKQSIFLSRSAVTEGESVLIHAVVSNDDPGTFKGTLKLRDGDDAIGSVPVSLESGKAIAVSVSWQPAAGKRTVSADLTDQAGATVETMSETFTIAAKPKPVATTTSTQPAAAIESSESIQDQIGTYAPAVQGATAPVFEAIDTARGSLADVLDNQLVLAKQKVGQVEGAQTEEGELPETVGGFWLALWTLYLYVLTVLRFLIGNAGVFYPVFAVLVLLLLWKTFRRFGRRS